MIIDTNKPQKYPYNCYFIYVLKLCKGKYYVGLSHNVKKRFERHKCGEGAKWTQLYKPIKILEATKTPYNSYKNAGPMEDAKTIEMMKKYGRENVRGGIYSAVDQDIVDNLLGKQKCNKIDRVFENKDYNKKPNKKKKKPPANLRHLPFADFEICIYSVPDRIYVKHKVETIQNQILLRNRKVITVYVDYKRNKVWISKKDMNEYKDMIEDALKV